MTSRELNLKLISAFPELKVKYKKKTEWQEGDETGSHVVYGDILVPILEALLEGKQYSKTKKYFDFLESLLLSGDVSGHFSGTQGSLPDVKYPGNNPAKSPGKGFEWRGRGDPASGKGNWYNPKTREMWHPDLSHAPPIGPHWDYTDSTDNTFRVYEDGRIEPS
jgi:hypothetical protein